MKESRLKISKEDDVQFLMHGPIKRLFSLKWWFILFLLLALFAAGFSIYSKISSIQKVSPSPPSGARGSSTLFVSTAFYQAQTGDTEDTATTKLKMYIMTGIYTLLAIVTLMSILVTLFTKDEERLKTAGDISKTCIGFFIGVATGLF